jgi:hypothetical protein
VTVPPTVNDVGGGGGGGSPLLELLLDDEALPDVPPDDPVVGVLPAS